MTTPPRNPRLWVGVIEPRRSVWPAIFQTIGTGLVSGVGTAVAILLMTPVLQEAFLTPETCDDPAGLHIVSGVSAEGEFLPEEPGYPPENVLDGDTTTPWVENGDGLGLGESLTLTVPAGEDVRLICIVNGFAKAETSFNRNAVVRQFEVTTDRGQSTSMLRPRSVENMGIYESLDFARGVTSRVKLTVMLASAGTGTIIDADTAISEVELWASD